MAKRARKSTQADSPFSEVADNGAEPAAAPEPLSPLPLREHLGRCAECGFEVMYCSLPSGTGFRLIGSDAALGVGEHARPICPNGHGELEIADDAIPAADAIGQVAEKLAAAEQLPLIDTTPEFNSPGAYLELERMAVEADRLQRIWKDDADQAKQSKESYDTAAKLYVSAALEFRRRRLAKRDTAEAGDATQIAAADLYKAVAAAGQILLPGTIEGWSDEQRAAVAGWTTMPERERPAVLGTPHVAASGVESGAVPGDTYVCCATCGTRLASIPTGSDGDGVMLYHGGAKVGTDCPGAEPQRYPKKTRKKRTRAAQESPTIDEAAEPTHEPDDPEVAQPDQAPVGDEATE